VANNNRELKKKRKTAKQNNNTAEKTNYAQKKTETKYNNCNKRQKRNPPLDKNMRNSLINEIKLAEFIWDKKNPNYGNSYMRDKFWKEMDEVYYPRRGSSETFYQSGRTTLTKAMNAHAASMRSGTGVGIPPAWQRAYSDWSFMKSQIGTVPVRKGEILSNTRDKKLLLKAQAGSTSRIQTPNHNHLETQITLNTLLDYLNSQITSDTCDQFGKLLADHIRKFPSADRAMVFNALQRTVIYIANQQKVDLGYTSLSTSVETSTDVSSKSSNVETTCSLSDITQQEEYLIKQVQEFKDAADISRTLPIDVNMIQMSEDEYFVVQTQTDGLKISDISDNDAKDANISIKENSNEEVIKIINCCVFY